MSKSETPGAVGARLEPGVRPHLDAAMTSVWALVRSGPNFDGRSADVRNALADLVVAAVLIERRRWQSQCVGKRHDGCIYTATCGSACNKCGRVA